MINNTKIQLLTLVIPCYNVEVEIRDAVSRLIIFRSELPNFEAELIFIDNESSDIIPPLLKSSVPQDARKRLINFISHFRYQNRITAMIDVAA